MSMADSKNCDLTKKPIRKEMRKLKKFQHSIHEHLGIVPSDVPHKNIVLCNAGLSTGLREHDLLTTFNSFGPIEKVILLPGKSFSIVAFYDVESANEAHNRIHGTNLLSQHGQPLYITFLPSLPSNNENECNTPPEGLVLIENFISPEEENALLACINWDESTVKSDMKNRRVRHYGYEFLYGINNIDVHSPLEENIPTCCDFLWKQLKDRGYAFDGIPNQLTVNQYAPGQGIPSHIDTHSAFLSPLISLSLGSSIVMEFKKKSVEDENQYYKVVLPSRSILIMDGPSRYEWAHGIAPKTYDIINGQVIERGHRTSFTFRWIRPDGICKCSFPQHCDTFKKQLATPDVNLKQLASQIEEQHVHQVYEEIASHFSDTRNKIWPSVRNFVESLSMGSILVDVGCGNGKNLHIRDDILPIGLEYSSSLAEFAAHNEIYDKDKNVVKKMSFSQVMRGNCLYLPFKSESVDAVMSIAVFHHLVTEERRINAINEMVRLLRPGGKGLITVWAMDQNRQSTKTSYLKQDRKNRHTNSSIQNDDSLSVLQSIKDNNGDLSDVKLPVHTNRTQFLYQDMLVPWKLKSNSTTNSEISNKTDFMRFYHVFEEDELKNLCESICNVEIESYFYEEGNWCVVFRKTI